MRIAPTSIKKAGAASVVGLVAATALVAVTPAHASGTASITSISQPAIGQGAQRIVEYLSGTGIQETARVTVSGRGVWSSDEYPGFVGAQLITVSPGAFTGPRDLTVTNPDGTSATCSGCVTIDPAPLLTSVDSSLQAGAGMRGAGRVGPVFLHGSGFSGSNAWFGFPTGMTKATDISPTLAEAFLAIDQGTAPGPYDVTFVNSDGGRGRCERCFTVFPGPVITGMTPTSFIRGYEYPVTITGHNFDQGMTPFVFVLHGGITVDNTAVSTDGTSIRFDLNIGKNVYLNSSRGILLGLLNPAPGYGSAGPIQLTVTKSCGTTTC
jgi:hypothetical protein